MSNHVCYSNAVFIILFCFFKKYAKYVCIGIFYDSKHKKTTAHFF